MSDPPPHKNIEVSYDEALLMAVSLHREMRLDGAEVVYRRLIEIDPADPNVRHYLGMLLCQRGRPGERDEAVRLMRWSVQAAPEVAAWHNNLGNALLDGHETEAAERAYRRCSELDPDNVEALSNLACLMRSTGRAAESQALFERALALRPDLSSLHANYATLLAQQRRVDEAQRHYLRALELQPENPVVTKFLGVMYAQTGQLDKAAALFRDWVEREPGSAQARHLLAAVSGEPAPERASDDYVTEVFDHFAASFDERLTDLGYQAPKLVGERLAELLGEPAAVRDIVDAGAGTGLCAPWLVPYARCLVGVDLSEGMLRRAEGRGGYHELHVGELVEHLRAHPGAYDVVVSADTLCYFGRLDVPLEAAYAALRPGGLVLFTVELRPDGADHALQPQGRYHHGRAYVLRTLAASGFTSTAARDVVLRQDSGKNVGGLLVSARRPPAGNA